MNSTTNHTLDGPAFTLTGVRLTGLMVKSFFLRTLDLGMGTFGTWSSVRRWSHDRYETNAAAPRPENSGHGADDGDDPAFPWRFGVPVVCLLAGLLLAATHGVSGGGEIRRSDSPRLVDLVRDAQQSVDRLSAQRDALAAQIDSTHGALGRRPRPDRDAGPRRRAGRRRRAWTRCTGPGWS